MLVDSPGLDFHHFMCAGGSRRERLLRNTDQIAAEIIRMISGSLGLVVAIPIAAIMAAFLA